MTSSYFGFYEGVKLYIIISKMMKGERLMENKSKQIEEKLRLIEKGFPKDPCNTTRLTMQVNVVAKIEAIINLRSSVFTILEFTISCRIFRKSIKIRVRLFRFNTRLTGKITRLSQSRIGLVNQKRNVLMLWRSCEGRFRLIVISGFT